jgi:ankyrin repeat protein
MSAIKTLSAKQMKTIVILFLTINSLHAQSFCSPQTPDDPQTPLMRAAEAGRLEEVRNLLKSGADINEAIPGIGVTVLMIAAGRGDLQMVKVLLAAGANPNAAGGVAHGGFWSVLTFAMKPQNKNRLELIDTLIAAGAKLNPQPGFPESPLQAAVKSDDIEMLKALLQRGSDVNWENEIGDTALITAIAIAEPNVDIVRVLLNAGANPNKPRLWVGDDCVSLLTFLGLPSRNSKDKVRVELRRLLVQAGAKNFSVNSRGKPCKQ